MPPGCVLCFFRDVVDHLIAVEKPQRIQKIRTEMGSLAIYRVERPDGPVALATPGVGGPISAGVLEIATVLGGRYFVCCGGAGVLDSSIEVEHVMLAASAVRDEGTSYHYMAPSRLVECTAGALAALRATLTEHGVPFSEVRTWTTDAYFRETRGKVRRRREEGCVCVEMECASLFAVGRFRKVEIAALLYAGDDVSGERWDRRDWTDREDTRSRLLELAFAACLRGTKNAGRRGSEDDG
jgi:uridine phosphorylase